MLKIYAVHAFAEPFDESPEAIFTVAARDDDEALRLVGQHDAGKFYRKLAAQDYPGSCVITFEKVHSSKRPKG
jgi:hypothetical protein